MLMASPLGVLLVGPTASTTEVEDDIDGRPPGGRCRWVQQRPTQRWKMMLMVGPLGGAVGGSNSVDHQG
jgi:hypothetical protein